jgi:hypothetical protein
VASEGITTNIYFNNVLVFIEGLDCASTAVQCGPFPDPLLARRFSPFLFVSGELFAVCLSLQNSKKTGR